MATILVVDDNATNRELLRTLLEHRGHQVVEASDGLQALELAHSARPALVIADILMPTMDGYELVRRMRDDASLASIPVVFWTAHYLESEARSLALSASVSAVLTKPCDPEDVFRLVDSLLGTPTVAAAETPVTYAEDHRRLLTDKLAEEVASLTKARARLAALVDLGIELGSQVQPKMLVERACRAARDVIGARYGALAITNGPGPRYRHFATAGLAPDVGDGLSTHAAGAESVLGQLLTDRRACRRREVDAAALGLPEGFPAPRSFLAVPIESPTRLHGWLALADKIGADEFGADDEELLCVLARQLGRTYENGSLHAELKARAAALEQEVADRQRAEAAVLASEKQLRAIFEQALDGLLIVGDDGRVIDANAAAWALSGVDPTMLTSVWLGDLLTDAAGALEALRSSPTHPRRPREITLRRPDGAARIVEQRVALNVLPGHHLVTWRDYSEQRRLEAQFRHAQKMEAVGRLAGGVAHDFNNILTVINGFADILKSELAPNDPRQESLAEIRKAGDMAASLTAQLLAFSRKQVLTPRPVQVDQLLTGMDRMLRRILGEDVELVTSLAPSLPSILVDPSQVEHALVNLAVNARDAMPRGGRLTIETREVEMDADGLRPGMTPGRYVMVSVADTGIGMDEATKSRLFEPFFTTKPLGKGTGLGLATVHGIVTQSGGHVWVYSELGQGTVFKVYFPAAETTSAAATTTPAARAVPRGNEAVLLVEDDQAVKRLVKRTLEAQGYLVLEAADVDDALSKCETHDGALHLLVTDVIMPVMSGPDLVRRVAALRPCMKVLFMSGYTGDVILDSGGLPEGFAFLEKPFTPDALARKVREVLDAPSSEAGGPTAKD